MENNQIPRELTSKVYTSELTGHEEQDLQWNPCVLVGFEGYTNHEGDVSTVRPLVLVQKWVEKDQSWY